MSESKENIAKAIIEVMKAVKGIDKSMNVGTGNSSYKGVADKDVKEIIGKAMTANGLCIIPNSISAKTDINRWEEETQYGIKQKQSIFTEVTTSYTLLHESGETMPLVGYGHGVDTQDKGAGKATTYALKYALLYTFMVPTGKIDDTDNTHSDQHPTPQKVDNRPELKPDTPQWKDAVEYLKADGSIPKILTKYKISKSNQEKLKEQAI